MFFDTFTEVSILAWSSQFFSDPVTKYIQIHPEL